MSVPSTSGIALLLRFALIEVVVVLLGIVFVRREVYLGGHFGEMVLHWQEYAVLALSFVDGLVRGQARALSTSPFRKRSLQFFLPFSLFLFVSCASLCDKLKVGCIREEWFRDIGLFIMGGGIILLILTQRTSPQALLKAASTQESAAITASESTVSALPESKPGTVSEAVSTATEEETPALGLDKSLETEPSSVPPTPTVVSSDEAKQTFCSADLKGPWRYLRYPSRTAILLELIGLSMALAAWMPIFTLPGLIILFKWEIADLESFRIHEFGDDYLKYKESSWYLVPYVY